MTKNDHIDFQILKALLGKKYPQNPLVMPVWFLEYVNKRSDCHFWESDLEELDKSGLCMPLLKVQNPFTFHEIQEKDANSNVIKWKKHEVKNEISDEKVVKVVGESPQSQQDWKNAVKENRIIFPTVDNFEDWKYHNERREVSPRNINLVSVYYHPFQAFRAIEAIELKNAKLHMSKEPSSQEMAVEWIQGSWNRLKNERERFRSDESWKKAFLLILLIEDKYLPQIRENVQYSNLSYRDGYLYEDWSERFDCKNALKLSGFSINEVISLRERFAILGRRLDDNHHLFPIIRHMDLYQRNKISKKLRLAWDYYELNEMLGDFIEDVTGEKQSLPDDLTYSTGTWKTKAYNFPISQIDYKRGNALPNILRYYGLDPRSRIYIFVEGMTERKYIEEWFSVNNLSIIELKIIVISLDSSSGVKSDIFKRQASNAKDQDAAIYVLIDDDGKREDHIKNLQEWKDSGYIKSIFDDADLNNPDHLPIGAMIWDFCFEVHNFSSRQLGDAFRELLIEEHGEENINIEVLNASIKEIEQEEHSDVIKKIEHISKYSRRRTLIKNEHVRFSKVKMGEILARLYHEEDNSINKILEMILYIASLDTAIFNPIY